MSVKQKRQWRIKYCERCDIRARFRGPLCQDCEDLEKPIPPPLTFAPGWWITRQYVVDRQVEAYLRVANHKPKVARCRICGDWKPIKGQCPTCQTHRKQRT